MLLPRLSTRQFLLTIMVATVAIAPLLIAIGYAYEGNEWALGLFVALASVVGAFMLYALLFAVAWVFVESRYRDDRPKAQNPFATEAPPQQVVPPVDP
jgi:uncharacterized membrane protein